MLKLENNNGLAFENDKGDNPKRPDFTGEVLVNGSRFEIALWKRQTKAGKAMLSMVTKPAKEQQAEPKLAWQ